MGFSKYNKDRPFLVVSHTSIPAKGQLTSTKNWGELAKWDLNENIVIVDRVNNKHITKSSVIIDILQTTTVKNRFEPSHSNDEVVKYYLKKYNKQVAEGIQIWMTKNHSGDTEKAKSLIQTLEDELNKIEVKVQDEK